MFNKKVLLCTLLIVLLLISGCGKSIVAKVMEQKTTEEIIPEQEKQVSITVTLNEKPTVEIINSLEKVGLKVESIQDKVITGKVGESKVEGLKKKEEVVNVEGKKEGGGQTGSLQDQQLIDDARTRLNITVGPYIDPEVWNEVQKNGNVYVGARFRIAGNYDTYQIYINEVKAKLTDKEKESLEVLGVGRAFRVEISESSINQLKDYPNLLEIRLVHK